MYGHSDQDVYTLRRIYVHQILRVMGTFSVKCSNCKNEMLVEDSFLGLQIVCPQCKHQFKLEKEPSEPAENVSSFCLGDPVPELKGSTPVVLSIGKERFRVTSWQEVLRTLCESVFEKRQNSDTSEIRYVYFSKTNPGAPRRIHIDKSSKGLLTPIKIREDFWIEWNLREKDVLILISWMCKKYGYPIPRVKFFYVEEGMEVTIPAIEVPSSEPKYEETAESKTAEPEIVENSAVGEEPAQSAKEENVDETSGTVISAVSSPVFNLESVKKTMLEFFPQGFSFAETSVRLLNSKLDVPLSDKELRMLKREMFHRSDQVWLLPEMVSTKKAIANSVHLADRWLVEYGAFSLSVLRENFSVPLRNLPNPERDFRFFVTAVVLPRMKQRAQVIGKQTLQQCIPATVSEAEVLTQEAKHIRKILQDAGDAVSLEQLDNATPVLNTSLDKMLVEEYIPDAVEFQMDDITYWKLLEYFYLPETFNEDLSAAIEALESGNEMVTLPLIDLELKKSYDCDFSEEYAIPDDGAFRQIVSLCYVGTEPRRWKNRMFSKSETQDNPHMLDYFFAENPGVFHESVFFEYLKRTRGLTNNQTSVRFYLLPSCIRLDRDYWIKKEIFQEQCNLQDEEYHQISQSLLIRLGSESFLPIGNLPNGFFDELPEVILNGRLQAWNAYLLVSIAYLLLDDVRIVNAEPSCYIVTAMAVPMDADVSDGVLDYVLKDYMISGFDSTAPDEIFEYLRKNKVRMRKTKEIMDRIREIFGNS